ncbi:MAG: TIGR03943 family protein [Acetanaerobacterium sp.]
MKSRTINTQTVLEGLCFAIFSAVLFDLVYSGRYLSYVTPKMAPYLYFAAGLMLIWSIVSFARMFRPGYRTRVLHCLILVLPAILLILPHTPVSSADLSSGFTAGTALSEFSTGSTAVPRVGDSVESSSVEDIPSTDEENLPTSDEIHETYVLQTQPPETLSGLNEAKRSITIEDEQFYDWINEIHLGIDQYIGYHIRVKGFVYRDDEAFLPNQFVAARLLMTCCVADLVPCGILCQYDSTQSLTTDDWIWVEGTLAQGEYMGAEEIIIDVDRITPAEKPAQDYLYPY